MVVTWLIAIAPWAVTWYRTEGLTAIAFRFPPFRLLSVLGVELPGGQPLLPAWEAASFRVTPKLTVAGHVHMPALAIGLVVVALSIVYPRRGVAFKRRMPIHPVRAFGLLHVVLAGVLLAGTALFARYHAGVTVPVGGLFAFVFAYLLLSAYLTSDGEAVGTPPA